MSNDLSRPPHALSKVETPNEQPTGFFGKARHYFTHRVDPLTSLFLVLPLYIIYQIGVLVQMRCTAAGCSFVRNGVDFITGSVLDATHGSRLAFGLITLGVGAALGIGVLWARRRSKLHPRMFIPVVLESAIYASLVGPAIVATQHAVGLGAPGQQNFLGDVISSCGAGLHEELIFRAILFAGLCFALKKLGTNRFFAVIFAGIVSSVCFSAVHYLGSLGETFQMQSFVFRVFAGAIFALIYGTRGFAIAAWTHCLYDVWVFAGQRFLGH